MKTNFERIADIKRLQFIIKILSTALPPNATVLDVGCGNGIISRNLGQVGFRVEGIDISEKAIELAKSSNTLDNVSFNKMNADQLSINPKKYEAVICSEVLEHLDEPRKLLQILHHSLKDDGILVVTVPNGRGPRELLVTRPTQALIRKNNWMWKSIKKIKIALGYDGTTVQSSADDLTHKQFFTLYSLKELANDTNFKIIRLGKTNFIEDVFPISFLTKRVKLFQKIDCAIADFLPYELNGGFVTVWKKH